MIGRDSRDQVYELTVRGRLGPVLRARLERVAETTTSEALTIMCLPARDGRDLVDIVAMLGSRGLQATTILTFD
jgi:hypothetical protein